MGRWDDGTIEQGSDGTMVLRQDQQPGFDKLSHRQGPVGGGLDLERR
jgi:hypothetical protein